MTTLVAKAFAEKKNVEKRVINYPETGIDYIANEISKRYQASRGKLCLKTEFVRIQHHNKGVRVWVKENGSEKEIEDKFLVSTIPISHLLRMLEPQIPTNIEEAKNRLRYHNLFLVYMFIGREKALNGQASIYFTEESFFSGVSQTSQA